MDFPNKLCFSIIIVLAVFACKKTGIADPIIEDSSLGCTDVKAKNFKSTAITDDCGCEYNIASIIGKTPPTEFTQKVLIEEHSGTWCGWCTLGKETTEKLVQDNRVLGVEIHYNDQMAELDEVFIPLKNKYGYPAWPSGMVNRIKSVTGTTFIMGEDQWKDNVNTILSNPKTNIGIALESVINGNNIQALVHFKLNGKAEGKFGIGMYLVENAVEGYPQLNYLSRNVNFLGRWGFSQPSEIRDIKHYNVVRQVLADHVNGFPVSNYALENNKIYSRLFESVFSDKIVNKSNCVLVAFVISETGQILNTAYAKINEISDWN